MRHLLEAFEACPCRARYYRKLSDKAKATGNVARSRQAHEIIACSVACRVHCRAGIPSFCHIWRGQRGRYASKLPCPRARNQACPCHRTSISHALRRHIMQTVLRICCLCDVWRPPDLVLHCRRPEKSGLPWQWTSRQMASFGYCLTPHCNSSPY